MPTISSPVTGSAQTGLTSPTHTLTADVPPNAFGRQYAVTALGGTQTGVRTHSASDPFTVTIERPPVIRAVPPVSASGVLPKVPLNTYVVRVRKGAICVVNQAPQLAQFELRLGIPAGSDVNDSEDLRSALSLMGGVIAQISASLGDMLITGIV
jgi:hypothetical protein